MAVTLLHVLVLGVIAAAADDVPISWWSPPRASLSCIVPDAERIPARRPPPPLNADDKSRPKQPYLWRRAKGDEELKRVLSNGTLEVSRKKDGSSEGLYQCGARHHAGLVLGYPLRLKFAYLDKQFSVHPENASAWAGQPYVLGCEINSGPEAVISWQRDGEPLPNNDRYFVLKNQLLILNVKKEDAGLYRCKATNRQVNRTRLSHGGRLQVVDYDGDVVLEPSMLAVQYDSNILGTKGEDLLLACPVTGYPRPKLIWEHTPPGERTGELEQEEEVLTLRSLADFHEGAYTCRVEGHSDLAKSFNVTIAVPVNITAPPASKQTIRASTVRFNCTASGNPTPTITWYKNGNPLALAGRIVVRASANGGERMELLIRSVTSADTGIYQCFAHNGHSSGSAWAFLNVTGTGAAAPSGISCAPVGARHVLVRWPTINGSIAYTVQISEPGGPSLPSQPRTTTEETVTLVEALKPYNFQVQAYILSSIVNKNVASDLSESVTCQGQGVPIRFKRMGEKISIMWKHFAVQNPGVKEWILQYKVENDTEVHNISLAAAVTSYNLTMPAASSLHLRVLGTRELPWLHQNLSIVPWTSTAEALQTDSDSGDAPSKVQKVEVTEISPREFTVRWQVDDDQTSGESYMYKVCTTKLGDKEECVETHDTWVQVLGLTPESKYSVRVRARIPSRPSFTSEFTQPLYISTPPESAQHIRGLSYKVIDTNTLRVSWNSAPDKYTVHFNTDLNVPYEQWPSIYAVGNTVLLSGVDMSKELFVMVSGPSEHSSILHIPIQVPEVTELKYTYTPTGLQVTWKGDGPRVVKYSQNISKPIDKWHTINVTTESVSINDIDNSQFTFVMVTAPGQLATMVHNIPARVLDDNSLLYLGIGVGFSVIILCTVIVSALCLWRKRKRNNSPIRSRRRNDSLAEGHEEEAAEMKNISGQLANGGGSKDAGEPLLNGHVHITENPNVSKTPNGRMRKGPRYEPAFDVSRYDEPDTTLDTVLDDTSTSFNLLDTSRRVEFDLSRSSHNLSANNSFNKLPDDNMNSELTRSTDFPIDNSKILPTLQPNG